MDAQEPTQEDINEWHVENVPPVYVEVLDALCVDCGATTYTGNYLCNDCEYRRW